MPPSELVAPASPLGLPAPYLALAIFKGVGFVLHMWPMHLWYAGLILAAVLRFRGGEHARTWSTHLFRQMPIIIAFGVNFGILALLFLQVAYYRAFYPATILMAWPWFSIFFGLTLAYYGVYVYVIRLSHNSLTPLTRALGWAAAVVFIAEGFLFANALSLMTNVGGWKALWERTSVAGATLGTGLNTADPTLWPRWLMMFGLAITTTAAYVVLDAAFLSRKESEAYRGWAGGFALKVYTVGLIWFAAFGSWYVFGTWAPAVRQVMFRWPIALLMAATALSPGLPWLLVFAQRRQVARGLAIGTVAAQSGVLAINAASRQIVQNVELGRFVDVTAERVNPQWGAAAVFVVLLLVGLGVLGWIIAQVIAAERRQAEPES